MNSGIYVSPEVSREWNEYRQDAGVQYVKFEINDKDAFFVKAKGRFNGDFITEAQNLLVVKEPSYVLLRKDNSDKFYLIFYVPVNAKIRSKMVYSSSLNSLKLGLGTDHLLAEIYVTDSQELTQKSLDQAGQPVDKSRLLTQQEALAQSAAYSQTSLETQSKVAVDLPVTLTSSSENALQQYKQRNINTIIFILNDNEALDASDISNKTLSDVSAILTPTQPAFIHHRYIHTSPDGQPAEKNIFIYYCPTKARPKDKMFYSATKSIVVKLLDQMGTPREAGFEATDASDISDANAHREVYPPSQQRVVVAKPKPAARGGRSTAHLSFDE